MRKPGGRKNQSHLARNALIAIAVTAAIVAGGWYYISSAQTAAANDAACSSVPSQLGTYVRINTTQGCIELQLYPASAPLSVSNFLNLTKAGFYNSLVWHRISAGAHVIQSGDQLTRDAGGDRSTWGTGGSAQTVPLEVSNSSLHNDRGYVGMARGEDPNSGSSQFYISFLNNRDFDTRYTVFGKVIVGMDVVDKISNLPVYNQAEQYPEQPIDPGQAMITGVNVVHTP